MVLRRFTTCLLKASNATLTVTPRTGKSTRTGSEYVSSRYRTTTPSGAILPEPQRSPFAYVGVVCAVVFGILVGAAISKSVANFLEENELFVPSDDDDDDD